MIVPERISWAVDQLSVRPADRILEIGCGGGHAVALICEALESGCITAIDRSALQVTRARKRNAQCITAGRARIEHIPLDDAAVTLAATFPKIFAINVNAFWTSPGVATASLTQLLGAHGRAYVIYEPPSAASLRKLQASLPPLFESNGFRIDEIRTARFASRHGIMLIARLRS